jgi:phospholipase C
MFSLRYAAIFVVFSAATLLTGCQGLSNTPPPNPGGNLQNSVNHIIFMAQENRGFDHYFGQMPQYLAQNGYPQTVDGTPQNAQNVDQNGATVTPFHMISQCTENYSPFWNDGHLDFNYEAPTTTNPMLDGFVRDAANFSKAAGFTDVLGHRVMGYFDSTDLPYYYFLAANFATSDRWFSPVMSRTQPNRMYMLAATSAGHVYPLPPNAPRLNIPTIFDVLQAANITWKVYITDDFENPLYLGSAFNDFASVTNPAYTQNFVSAKQFVSDAQAGKLPQVALIEPGYNSGLDEHPYDTPGQPGDGVQTGSSYVSGLINGLMQSQSWKDSIFILTYDEGGGFFDHVPPQQTVSPDGIPPQPPQGDLQLGDICYNTTGGICDFDFTGYRIPLIVISPFTKKNYASHTVADYTAMLKLIETRFNLKSLTARDAAQMDMTEFFDFVNAPWMTPPSNVPSQPDTLPCTDQLPPGQ